jgi:hypothetical protein
MSKWDELQEEVIRASIKLKETPKSSSEEYYAAVRSFEFVVLALADLIHKTRDP